jgi:hypothetical protein
VIGIHPEWQPVCDPNQDFLFKRRQQAPVFPLGRAKFMGCFHAFSDADGALRFINYLEISL